VTEGRHDRLEKVSFDAGHGARLIVLMSAVAETELAVKDLLAKARAVDDFNESAARVAQALEIAERHGVRVAPRDLSIRGGGVAGHYGRMDGARIAITVLLLLGVLGVVVWSLAAGDAGNAATYASPLTGLAGICLGWLFTNDRLPTVLAATRRDAEAAATAQQS
jgi:hypothetical protein